MSSRLDAVTRSDGVLAAFEPDVASEARNRISDYENYFRIWQAGGVAV